jgi:hypothetical protein
MWFLIIVIISISLGIWKYPFIKYHAMRAGEGSIGCDACEDCKFCTFAVVATITAIVSLPLMLLWMFVMKPSWAKLVVWQKERTKAYTKTMEERE